MYLACADEELNQMSETLFRMNKKLIQDYNNLPWYKKLFIKDPSFEVIQNWAYFERVIRRHIANKKKS